MPNNEGSATKFFEVPNNALPATTSVPNNATLKLTENIFLAKDKSKSCVTYPHGKYETYGDCDEDFVVSSLPHGLVPIWSTDNLGTKLKIL